MASALLTNISRELACNREVMSEDTQLHPLIAASIGFSGIVLSLAVIFGNALVIAAVIRDPHLRGPQHAFIASLAVSDLLLGVAVLPFSLIKELLRQRWIFGSTFCTFWLSTDVFLCTASILNLCLISVDRFLSIRYALRYPQWRTMPRVIFSIILVWLLSAVISLPLLIIKSATANSTFISTHFNSCLEQCELVDEPYYIYYSSAGTFYIPMTVLVVLYISIFREARRRLAARSKLDPNRLDFLICQTMMPGLPGLRKNLKSLSSNTNNRTDGDKEDTLNNQQKQSKQLLVGSTLMQHKNSLFTGHTELTVTPRTGEVTSQAEGSALTGQDTDEETEKKCMQRRSSLVNMFQRRRLQRKQRERRTTLVLSLILGAFLVCWLPFFLIYLANGIWPNSIPRTVFTVFFWMGYLNSAINPIIYTFFNSEYRCAMRRVAMLPCGSK